MLNNIKSFFDTEVTLKFEFPSQQEFLRDKLSKYWHMGMSNEESVMKSFKTLSNGNYIIFYFDDAEDLFIQFAKDNGWLFLDFPAFKKTERSRKLKSLINLLDSHGISKMTRYDKFVQNKNKRYRIYEYKDQGKVVNVYFKRDYKLATQIAFDIGEKVYKIKNAKILRCTVGGN